MDLLVGHIVDSAVEGMQVVNEGHSSVGWGDDDCCRLAAMARLAGPLAVVWDSDSVSEEVEVKLLEVFAHELNMAEVG